VKKPRVVEALGQQQKVQPEKPATLVFYNDSTGIAQFRTETLPGQAESIERAAGMLAIQCLVRGQDPENFTVLVPAEESVSQRLIVRAKELLNEGRSLASPTPLSPRQKEILQSVVRQQANKEIASRLNITVRTVKFHISSLLNKFDAQSRVELAQKAASVLGAVPSQPGPLDSAEAAVPPPAYSDVRNKPLASSAVVDRPVRTLPFPQRMRTA